RDEKTFSIFYNIFKPAFVLLLNSTAQSDTDTGLGVDSGASVDDDYDSPNRLLFKFIVEGLGITAITTAGVLGNILSVFVLTRKKMYTKSINLLLLGLAISDTIFISSA